MENNFKKIYTRDTSLIIQQAWFKAFHRGLDIIGAKSPYNTPVIHYLYQGSIEIWENINCSNFFLDRLLEKNLNDSNFYDRTMNKYKKDISILQNKWAEGSADNIKDLTLFIDSVFSAIARFIIFYYSANDPRTPKKIRNKALRMREKDNLFASSDKFIRESLKKIYPEIKGYENCILKKEVIHIPSLKILQSRKISFVIKGETCAKVETIEDFARKNSNYHFCFEDINTNQDYIKGQIAYKGIARGIVKILRYNDQVNEVNKGCVLVSPMTTPEHILAMKKAIAFVTDEGGITCHAAIVSREMKKPCIVGTKIATQVLHDGDEIEVDANKGIVKIIKKF